MKKLLLRQRNQIRRFGYDIVRHKELPEWLDLHNVDAVLDIGANDGRYATEIRESGWNSKIVSFEPQPTAFERLCQRMHGDPGWSGHQIGLGSEDTELVLNTYQMDVLSSFLKKSEDEEITSFKVPVRRADLHLDEWLSGANRPFVKIDTQGFEKEVIAGFGKRTNDVIGWQLELSIIPSYEGQPLIEEMIGLMRSLGFVLWKFVPGLRDNQTLQSFEMDGIFFRSK